MIVVIYYQMKREQPPYIAYLKQSRRIATFTSVDNPKENTGELEEAFTRGMTFEEWENTHFRTLDGAQTHGWDAVEIVFDVSKPLQVGIEHIGHDNLIFPTSSVDIQSNLYVIRRHPVTKSVLLSFVSKYGFDKIQVDRLIDSFPKEVGDNDDPIYIYKSFCKHDDTVYVSWFHPDKCDDWLKAPIPLYLGRAKQVIRTEMQDQMVETVGPDGTRVIVTNKVPVQVPVWEDLKERQYPIVFLFYNETEQEKIFDHKGRVFLDNPKQEAQTAIASGFVNGLIRATNVYGSIEQDNSGSTAAPRQLETRLESGCIYDKPIKFWGTDYPDSIILNALQHFNVQNSEETGQLNFAVNNRKDSRKTAAEIHSAENQSSLLSSVSLTMFSSYIRKLYGFVWLIVQSRALQGKLRFLPITSVNAMGMPVTQTIVINRRN